MRPGKAGITMAERAGEVAANGLVINNIFILTLITL